MSSEKDQLIEKLNETLEKPGGKQAIRFILNSLGAIPAFGGLFAASAGLWSEKEQQKFNELLTDWATQTDSELKDVLIKVNSLLQTPTKPKMTLLFGEIIGNKNAEMFLSKSGNQIPLVLHNQTVNELEPFIENGWITIQSTGSISMMGADNRVGNHIEEIKRPYGMGSGFVITLNDTFLTE